MAIFEKALFTLLTSDANISSFVADRIYPVVIPQGSEFPAIKYFKVSKRKHYLFSGDSCLDRPRYQIDCYSEDALEAYQLAQAVEDLLSGYSGTINTQVVQGSFQENEMDGYESVDENVKLYKRSQDYFIWHTKN